MPPAAPERWPPPARRFMAFDRHMNLVLGDAEEFRKLPPKKGVAEEDVRGPPPACHPLATLPEARSCRCHVPVLAMLLGNRGCCC